MQDCSYTLCQGFSAYYYCCNMVNNNSRSSFFHKDAYLAGGVGKGMLVEMFEGENFLQFLIAL